jgi:hypothetical protein
MFNEGKNNPYNGLSKELIAGIKPLKEKVVVIAKGVYDKRSKTFRLKESVHIPNIDRIYDPFSEDWVDIALVTSIGKGGEPNLQPIWLDKSGQNMILLMPGNAKHEQIWQYLQLSNYFPESDRVQVKGFKRDSQKEVLCEVFDPQEEDRKDRKRRVLQAQALNRATTMDIEVAKRILAGQGERVDKMPDQTVMNKIEKYAWEYPEKFLDQGVASIVSIDGMIREAAKKDIIKYTQKSGEVSWVDGKVITQLRTKVGGSWYKDLTDWCMNTTEGAHFAESLESLL